MPLFGPYSVTVTGTDPLSSSFPATLFAPVVRQVVAELTDEHDRLESPLSCNVSTGFVALCVFALTRSKPLVSVIIVCNVDFES